MICVSESLIRLMLCHSNLNDIRICIITAAPKKLDSLSLKQEAIASFRAFIVTNDKKESSFLDRANNRLFRLCSS